MAAGSQGEQSVHVLDLGTGDPGRLRGFLTEQLRVVLEDRSVRLGVVGMMLVAASLVDVVTPEVGVDSGWMFIMPVAISAIAGGLREGLVVAFGASVLGGLFATFQPDDGFDTALLVSAVSARFALYGITAAVMGAFAEAHYSVQSSLRTLASIDPLTRVANVASFYEELRALESARVGFAFLLVDVDDLKAINDRYGHQSGSAAIQTVANVLRRVVRGTDCVARFGGDEFVVLLKDVDRPGAQIVSNRIRRMLDDEAIPGTGGRAVTVSIGAAFWPDDGATSEQLLANADAMMYADKRSKKTDKKGLAGAL
jgi:diguanylate cyclase (GGDEF)-like protein